MGCVEFILYTFFTLAAVCVMPPRELRGAAPALALRASGSHLGFESNWEHALLFARYVVVGQAI